LATKIDGNLVEHNNTSNKAPPISISQSLHEEFIKHNGLRKNKSDSSRLLRKLKMVSNRLKSVHNCLFSSASFVIKYTLHPNIAHRMGILALIHQ
jgi:hypothetical protein